MMKYKLFLPVLSICLLAACGNNQQAPAGGDAGSKPTSAASYRKLDLLEKMFNNDNWMKIAGDDTSYYYFSRIPARINVHRFKMIKGDSVITGESVMQFSQDTLFWNYDDSTRLYLSNSSANSCEWSRLSDSPGRPFLALEAKNDKHIDVTERMQEKYSLTRTLTLSTFLARSHYDYLHGTHLAFDTTSFNHPELNRNP